MIKIKWILFILAISLLPFQPVSISSQTCQWEKDKLCSPLCNANNDGDCCELNKAVYGGLYGSEEECKACFFESDGVCPQVCKMDSDSDCCIQNSGIWTNNKCVKDFPPSFTWRDRHGINYFTPPKDQGLAQACFAFAWAALFESYISLYYNSDLNIDLSEQHMFSCYGAATFLTGVVDEACFPFEGGGFICRTM